MKDGLTDDYTMDMAAYGSAYSEVTSLVDQARKILDVLGAKIPDIEEWQDEDIDIAIKLLEGYSHIIESEDEIPLFIFDEDIEDLQEQLEYIRSNTISDADEVPDIVPPAKVVRTHAVAERLRSMLVTMTAADMMIDAIENVKEYGRFVGAGERSIEVQINGIDKEMWEQSMAKVSEEEDDPDE